MTTMEITLAIIGTVSSIFGIVSYIRSEIIKSNQKASVEILKEKLSGLNNGLINMFNAADAIVQIPKSREVSKEEFQDMGRQLRYQIYMLSKNIQETSKKIEKAKYDSLFKSSTIQDMTQVSRKPTKDN